MLRKLWQFLCSFFHPEVIEPLDLDAYYASLKEEAARWKQADPLTDQLLFSYYDEPLLSSRWDDENFYRTCVEEYEQLVCDAENEWQWDEKWKSAEHYVDSYYPELYQELLNLI